MDRAGPQIAEEQYPRGAEVSSMSKIVLLSTDQLDDDTRLKGIARSLAAANLSVVLVGSSESNKRIRASIGSIEVRKLPIELVLSSAKEEA